MKKLLCAASVVALTCALFGLVGCNSYEGSGSKDAASQEQLALTEPDPWEHEIQKTQSSYQQGKLADGVYSGQAVAFSGKVSVTISVQNNKITTIALTQDGETQSVGGYEAIRDGVFAQLIDAHQGPDFDAISGATYTSAAIQEALQHALDQARVS